MFKKCGNPVVFFMASCDVVLWPERLCYSDDEGLDEDLKDLIDDNPVEEEPEEDSEEEGGDGEKRKHQDSDLEEDLSDDDYDLLEENLGIKIGRKVCSLWAFPISV